MEYKSWFLILFVFLFLSGCASNQRKSPEVTEVIATNITSNGLKLFSYSVTMSMPQKRKEGLSRENGRGARNGRDKSGGMDEVKSDRESTKNRMKQMIYEKLESKLIDTGYCREGYIVLDRYFDREQAQIRGECKEGATEEDRKNFVNDENI